MFILAPVSVVAMYLLRVYEKLPSQRVLLQESNKIENESPGSGMMAVPQVAPVHFCNASHDVTTEPKRVSKAQDHW